MALVFMVCTQAGAQGLAIAKSSAKQGNADAAIAQAQQVIAATPTSADAHLLLCKLYGSIDQFESAVHACEAARDQQPQNADVVLALARAYGARADHAGPLTGMRMVSRIRENFERAVQLDPKNVEALSDLGEFYVDAPGIAGGGLDKARALLPRLQAVSSARAHRLAGMIAAKAGDYATADKEYAKELAVEHSPEAYVDLSSYYRKRRMWNESALNAVLAVQSDTKHGPDTVDAAQILIEEKRDQAVAQKGLRDYLAAAQEGAVKPTAKVRTLLGQSLSSTGDNAGAQMQFAAALSVAHDYAPARRAAGK